jgi:hypothetical protein
MSRGTADLGGLDMASFEPDEQGWDDLVRGIIRTDGARRMETVAAACNAADGLEDGYRAGTQGSGEQLTRRDLRATAITATYDAILSNAKNNTLIKNLHIAGGE